MADGIPMDHPTGNEVAVAQQLIGLFYVTFRQYLPDIRTADDPVSVPLLVHHKKPIPIFGSQLLQKPPVPGRPVAEPAVRAGYDHFRVHPSCKDLRHKLLRVHPADLFIKRVFHQIVHPRFLKQRNPLLIGHDHGRHGSRYQRSRRSGKCKDRHLVSHFLPMEHFP